MADSGAWEYGRDMMRERIQHTNIVVRTPRFQHGRIFLEFRRVVCFLQRSRPSVAPIHRGTLDSFRTRKRDLLVSYS